MAAALVILDARVASDRERWIETWSRWPAREVQAHPAYLELFAAPDELVRAASLESSSGVVLYPFVQRRIFDATDLTSPYGYGGPYSWGNREELAAVFWPAFDEWARSTDVVTEFVRVAVGTSDLLAYPGDLMSRQHNVIVAIDRDANAIWARYAHKVRKNVNKARAANLRIEVDPTGKRLDAFMGIYLATMSRRAADDRYRFSPELFLRMAETLPDQIVYFHALLGEEVVSTELALVSATSIYSFLGGTDERFFDLRPNDLLKHEMIGWAAEHGKTRFVLGGGFAPDDGIFQYKKAFAPDGVVPFFTGQRVFDLASYERLTRAREAEVGAPLAPSFFPQYRAPAAS